MNLSWHLSTRFKNSKKQNGFIGFIGKASSSGIGLGVAVLILAMSVINGFEQQLVERLLSVVPHVEYEAVDEPINQWPTKIKHVLNHESVDAAAPFINMTGMIQKSGVLKAAQIKGIAPIYESKVSGVQKYIVGTQLTDLKPGQLILGQDIAKQIKAQIGDKVSILLPQSVPDNHSTGNRFKPPLRKSFKLSGIIEMGGPVDKTMALIHLTDAQKIRSLKENQVTGLRMKIDNVYAANEVARRVGMQLPDRVYMSSWFRTQGGLYHDIQLVRIIVYIVVILIIAVASFNIVSTLVMEVKEKQQDIAILRTMGLKDKTVVQIFMLEGFMQALSGVILGVLVGVGVSLGIAELFVILENLIGIKFLQGQYFVEFLPSKLEWVDVLVISTTAIIMASLATVYPAWAATRIDPAEVLGQ